MGGACSLDERVVLVATGCTTRGHATVFLCFCAFSLSILLQACATVGVPLPKRAPTTAEGVDGPAAQMAKRYAALGAGGERVYEIDPKASAVRIYAFRGGKVAKLGHNHVLSAPHFRGYFHVPASGTAAGGFDLIFRLDELQMDDPQQRADSGGAYSAVLSTEDVASTREHMLGKDGLQAKEFPFVRIHSLQIVGEAPKFAVHLQVQMHGSDQEMWVPLDVGGLPDTLSVNGSFVLRQSDFGVQPYSVMGGLLAVEDAVVVSFHLKGN